MPAISVLMLMLLGAVCFGAQPNIVLIVSDDHAWTDYGFMDSTKVRTPRLDALARQARVFPRGYVPSSLCCPSLASIITGRYPHQHKVVCNDPPGPPNVPRREFYSSDTFREGRARLSGFLEKTPTLPRVLGQAGYASFQSGKWWQNSFKQGGFTHGMTHGNASQGGRHGDAGLEIGRKTMQPIYDFVDTAVSNRQPFMVWYAPMLPHDPHTPPARLLAKYTNATTSIHLARYWAMVEWFDETCGQLLDFLRERGLQENTIVAYVADNGWIQSPDGPRFAAKSKQSPYDGGLRTPIMVSWPGKIAAARIDTPVSSVDLMPTLLRLAGVSVPEELPGIDLMNDKAVKGRRAVFGACFTHDCVDLDRPESGLRWRWTVAGNWKLIVPHAANEKGAAELYDLQSDPFETTNLFGVESARAEELREMLDGWWNP